MGVQRSFRPLANYAHRSAVSDDDILTFEPVISDKRKPVCTATRRKARSRRPDQVA